MRHMMECRYLKTWKTKKVLFCEEVWKKSGETQLYLATLQLSYIMYNIDKNIKNFSCERKYHSSLKVLLLSVKNIAAPRVL